MTLFELAMSVGFVREIYRRLGERFRSYERGN